MLLFFDGLLILLAGYLLYGKVIQRLVMPDRRETPAIRHHDGVDYVVLPKWKNMLIQLLNIAGVGPVIGVILGIKFGEIVFFIIPIGNVIGGAVHDYISGMMSIRNDGANLPTLIKKYLGKGYYGIFGVFMTLLLLLVVAVFINIPAGLVNTSIKDGSLDLFWLAVVVIFIYYICATLFPVDKIIGKIYPVFGAVLLISSFAILGSLIFCLFKNPEMLTMSEGFRENMFTAANNHPVIPLLFVTIACGIISGFHATQSPIVARTMRSEKEGLDTYYGMMIAEGVIAMIWAAGAMAVYNANPALMLGKEVVTLRIIAERFLGQWWGQLTVIGVIILAITSGDTAMRSLRLSLAEMFKINQRKITSRLLLCLPLIVVISGLLWWSNQNAKTFGYLWNYFAWGNQVLAASTLLACTVWLYIRKKNIFYTLLPGMFMSFIVICFIFWTSREHGGPYGLGFSLRDAIIVSLLCVAALTFWLIKRCRKAAVKLGDREK